MSPTSKKRWASPADAAAAPDDTSSGVPPTCSAPAADVETLRDRVEFELRSVGFVWRGTRLAPPDGDSKEVARLLHRQRRRQGLLNSAAFVSEWEDRLLAHFARGADVDPASIKPKVEPVISAEDAALFRYASLGWSVPVSQGYGRRTRFLVRDTNTGRLIGIFAMGDPVFNLRVRDAVIGWSAEQRQDRLYNVFDAFVLGAVEPYRRLLGGKLVALATVAEETITVLTNKYRGTRTHIREQEKSPRPVLVTTTSALGRSSIYNRLVFNGRRVFVSVGFTEGYGHFQFSDELFYDLVSFLRQDGNRRRNRFGEGPNWKIRTIRAALEALGLPGDLLRHGVRREVFLAPLAVAWRAYLRGETNAVRPYAYELDDIADHYRRRWALPRANRDDTFRAFEPDQARLSEEIDQLRADGRGRRPDRSFT